MQVVISKSLIPPGGWKFHETGFLFEATTFDKLVETVVEYRLANSKPAGDPESEIMLQIGSKYSSFVLNKPVAMPPNTISKIQSFAVALKNYILNGGTLVDQNTANIRASICANCHNNVNDAAPSSCTVCGKIGEAGVNFVRSGVIGQRTTALGLKLKSCNLCGCDLKMKIWFPVKYFDPKSVEINKWPSFCWMKDDK